MSADVPTSIVPFTGLPVPLPLEPDRYWISVLPEQPAWFGAKALLPSPDLVKWVEVEAFTVPTGPNTTKRLKQLDPFFHRPIDPTTLKSDQPACLEEGWVLACGVNGAAIARGDSQELALQRLYDHLDQLPMAIDRIQACIDRGIYSPRWDGE